MRRRRRPILNESDNQNGAVSVNGVVWRCMYGGVFIHEGWLWFGRLREKLVYSYGKFSLLLD